MLNRRHLRIKILHTLYGYYSSDERDLPKAERQLFFGIQKFYELYILLFSAISALKGYSEERIEISKAKLVPTDEDLNPNRKFVDNRFLRQLIADSGLSAEYQKYKVDWSGDNKEVLGSIYKEFTASDTYREYMTSEESSFDEDKTYIISLFKSIICNNNRLHSDMIERSIFWSDDLDLASAMVIKSLKKMEQDVPLDLLPLFKDEDEKNFVTDLFRQTIIQNDENTKMISESLKNWDEDRLAKMDIILMKMALSEARHFKFIPTKVSMNEYIEISKFYSTPQSNKFINGILDKLFADLKKEGAIKKMGRGLLED